MTVGGLLYQILKMKKLLKWALYGIIALVGIGTLAVFILSEKYPEGTNASKADEVANSIMNALDKDGFDTIKYLAWNFADRQQYIWDKQSNNAIIKWGNVEVTMDLDNQVGDVLVDGQILQNDEKQKYLDDAWFYWCNDSYWMIAPFKMFDPGTSRVMVNDDGREGLMVKYDSGGVTPGDSYLWFYDDNYIPTGYKMWVNIIPVKGIYSSWDNWKTLPSGAKLAQKHEMKLFTLVIKDIREGNSYTDFGFSTDPFVILN